MPIDIKAKSPNIALTPVIFLRWLAAVTQLLFIMAADALFEIPVPAQPLLFLVGASFAVNIYAMMVHKRRQVPEAIVRRHLVFDILQFSAFLYFTGGTQNPFSILLLAPLAMAASLLSLYSLCLMLILAVLCIGTLTFGPYPLMWMHPKPDFSPQYLHASWVALFLALTFISFIIWRLAVEGRRINEALKSTHAILEEKRRLTALGALAAAAVHELGSPLGTIAIISREMEREMHPDDPFAEDIALLKTETEKCKKILADIARNPAKHFQTSELFRLDRMLMEIASSYSGAGGTIVANVVSRVPENLPQIPRNPNIEYGIGNLISNAVSFARTKVDITVEGTVDTIEIIITDDGPGFPIDILKSVGQPYISTREKRQDHMGLGIFIAINLLEATGAHMFFSNEQEGGAIIRVVWARSALEALVTAG